MPYPIQPLQHFFQKGHVLFSGKIHEGKINIGDITINNLRFADDIDALAGKEQELEVLAESLEKLAQIICLYKFLQEERTHLKEEP